MSDFQEEITDNNKKITYTLFLSPSLSRYYDFTSKQ